MKSSKETYIRQAPGNSVDDGLLAAEKLVDDGSKKKGVNDGPDNICPRSRSDIGDWSTEIVADVSGLVNVGA
jgi:hypothetical protein